MRLHDRRRSGLRTDQSNARILISVSAVLVVLASAWVIGRNIAGRPPAPDAYIGSVQMAPDHRGRCEQFQLDNKNSMLTPKGSVICRDVTATVPESVVVQESAPTSISAGTFGRVQGIGSHFKQR